MRSCEYINSKEFPFFATRNERTNKEPSFINVSAISFFDKLIVVDSGKLYYGGEEIQGSAGQLSAGQKQFAFIEDKVVIMPDKVYLDTKNLTLESMEAEEHAASVSAIKTTAPDQHGEQTLTLEGYSFSPMPFKVGDVVEVKINNVLYSDLVIRNIATSPYIAFTFLSSSKNFTTRTYSNASFKIERKVPDFDYICSSNNRIWGCVNSEQTIYCSVWGDPTNFFRYDAENNISAFSTKVSSGGNFTGCTQLGSTVLFFKEKMLHKIVGENPNSYHVYEYAIDGVAEGSFRSMQIINEVLYYMGTNGVYTYSGGAPACITRDFGNAVFRNGVGCSDGRRYYLKCDFYEKANEPSPYSTLLVYDLEHGVWTNEGYTDLRDSTMTDDGLYMLIGTGIYNTDSITTPIQSWIEWHIQFNPFYEKTAYRGKTSGYVYEKKHYSKLYIRAKVANHVVIKVRYDDGRWQEVGQIVGKKGVTTTVLPLSRCDKFELRLEGNGDFTLMGLSREYSTGSVRNE